MPFSQEEIESKDFLITLRGYDKEEVRAFLSAIATDYSAALEAAEKARKATGNIYESLGTEMGQLLQNAKDTADQLQQRAEEEATELRRRAEHEASALRDAATKSSKRLTEEAQARAVDVRSAAEKESQEKRAAADKYATETRAAADAHSEKVRGSADRYAIEVRSAAERDAAAKMQAANERVDQLRATEMKLRQRLKTVENVLASLREDFEDEEGGDTSPKLSEMKVERGQADTAQADNGAAAQTKR